MAPSKKKAVGEDYSSKQVTRSETLRVTRSVTRKQASDSSLIVSTEVPQQQRQKKTTKAKTLKKTKDTAVCKEKTTHSEEDKNDVADAGNESGEVEQVEDEAGKVEQADDDYATFKAIVIERCTQCIQFKKAATTVQEGLEAAVPGISVIVNPEKPRRGCFEVRQDGGRIFLSLLDMKRPFVPMRNLDMEKVITGIVDQIKG